MPGFFEILFGGKPKQQSTLNKNQKALFDKFSQGIESSPLYGAGNSFLQQLLSNQPGAFEAFEQPFKNQFEQQTIPMLAERFAGLGTGGGALNSSGFQQTLAQAGRGLSTDLAGLRSGLQMQSLPQALGYAQQPFSNYLNGLNINTRAQTPGSPGLFGGFAQGGGLSSLISALLGG